MSEEVRQEYAILNQFFPERKIKVLRLIQYQVRLLRHLILQVKEEN